MRPIDRTTVVAIGRTNSVTRRESSGWKKWEFQRVESRAVHALSRQEITATESAESGH